MLGKVKGGKEISQPDGLWGKNNLMSSHFRVEGKWGLNSVSLCATFYVRLSYESLNTSTSVSFIRYRRKYLWLKLQTFYGHRDRDILRSLRTK